MEDRFCPLSSDDFSGILTRGGTVLGTSRVNVSKVDMGNGTQKIKEFDSTQIGGTTTLAERLSAMTGLESRVTILGPCRGVGRRHQATDLSPPGWGQHAPTTSTRESTG